MREILFRGKRKDNGKFVYGFLAMEKCSSCKNGRLIYYTRPEIIPIGEIGEADYDGDGNYYEYVVIPETVGQYTGLTDKNGTKIFEGDIVRYPDAEMFPSSKETINEGFVDWDEETMCFYFTNRFVVDMEDFYIDNGKMVDVVVIGNIHDNPEL